MPDQALIRHVLLLSQSVRNMDHKLAMIKAYLHGSLAGCSAEETDRFMLGYEAALEALSDFIERMERPIDAAESANPLIRQG